MIDIGMWSKIHIRIGPNINRKRHSIPTIVDQTVHRIDNSMAMNTIPIGVTAKYPSVDIVVNMSLGIEQMGETLALMCNGVGRSVPASIRM